jgi:hypothetical protein
MSQFNLQPKIICFSQVLHIITFDCGKAVETNRSAESGLGFEFLFLSFKLAVMCRQLFADAERAEYSVEHLLIDSAGSGANIAEFLHS